MPQSVIVRLTSRAEKVLRQRNVTSAVRSRNVNIFAVIVEKILHLKAFGKSFMKIPFLQTVKITKVISSQVMIKK